jgi:integrase
MASLRAARGRLFVDFRWKGVRCREWTGRTDTAPNRVAARRLAKQIDGAIATGEFDYLAFFPDGAKRALFAPAPPAEGPPTVAAHARRWLDHRKPWLAGGTEYDYRRILEAHVIPSFGDRPVSALTIEDVEGFIATLKERKGTKGRKLSNRRANMVLAVLRLVLDAAVKRGWLDENPARAIQPLKEERADIDPLSFQEVQQLLAKASSGRRTAGTSPWRSSRASVPRSRSASSGRRSTGSPSPPASACAAASPGAAARAARRPPAPTGT